MHFRDRHPSFRLPEFYSVAAALFGKEVDIGGIKFSNPILQGSVGPKPITKPLYNYGTHPPVHLWVSGLTPEQATNICDRCVLVKALYEVWGNGITHELAALDATKRKKINNPLQNILDAPNESWCVRVRRHGVGKRGKSKASEAERNAILRVYSDILRLIAENNNPVNLMPGAADHRIYIVEDREALKLRYAYIGKELRRARGPYKGGIVSTKFSKALNIPSYDRNRHIFTLGASLKGRLQRKGGRTLDGRNYGNKSNGKDGAFYQRVVSQFSLKQRTYIGPTTMDAEMSFIIANAAGVKEGSRVLDPYCGTGGLLLACAALGADADLSFGIDIDGLVLAGMLSARPNEARAFRGERRRLRSLETQVSCSTSMISVANEDLRSEIEGGVEQEKDLEEHEREVMNREPKPTLSIEANFYAHGLQPPHFLCTDAALLPEAIEVYRCEHNQTEVGPVEFDAIVTDPPYGKREWLGIPGASGDTVEDSSTEIFYKHQQFESLRTLQERIDGIVQLASKCLATNGKLVFFLPIRADLPKEGIAESNDDEEKAILKLIPSHPNLELLCISREALNNRMHRLLVTMKRV